MVGALHSYATSSTTKQRAQARISAPLKKVDMWLSPNFCNACTARTGWQFLDMLS